MTHGSANRYRAAWTLRMPEMLSPMMQSKLKQLHGVNNCAVKWAAQSRETGLDASGP